MTTYAAPLQHSALEGDAGYAYVFGPGARRRFYDSLDVAMAGIVELVGDAASSGSDVIRVLDVGNIGWNLAMTALATETDTVPDSQPVTGYTSLTVAPYGIGHSETLFASVLMRPDVRSAIGIDAQLERMPEVWGATIRSLVCTVGGAFSSSVGSATAALTMDDMLDLVELRTATMGADQPFGVVLHGTQVNQLRRSAQAHPNFQEAVIDFAATTDTLQTANQIGNLFGLGMSALKTNDVITSGGAYKGFGMTRGGIGWGRASTAMLSASQIRQQIVAVLPEFGVVLTAPDMSGNGSRKVEGRAFIGAAAGSSSVYLQRVVQSVTE